MRMSLTSLAAIAGVAACLGLSSPAMSAQVMNSDEIMYFGKITPVPEGKNEGPIPIDGPFFVPDQAVVLYEDANFTMPSDEIYIRGSELYFASDVNDVLVLSGVKIIRKMQENGQFQEIGSWFRTDAGGPVFQAGVLQVRSDVPENAVWALLITGFGAIGALLRRRREAFVV